MLTEKSTQQKSLLEAVGKSFYDSIGDIVFGMEDGTVSIFGLVFGVASSTTSSSLMISLRKAYGAKIVHLSALLLALLFPLASLVSCDQPAPPLFESLKQGIPAAALQSPVKGTLPDATELRVGISFKIDPKVLNLVGQQPLQPGQSSNLEQFASRLGINDGTYQKIEGFFNAKGLVLKLSKLRTYLSLQAKAETFAQLLQTKFVIHLYKGRRFYAPATPPRVPSFLAGVIDAITGLDNYSGQPRHALHFNYRGSRVSQSGALDCSPDGQTLATADVAGAYGYNALWQRGLHGENMTINLVETDGSYQDDIQNYLSCVHFKGHLSIVNVDGSPSDAEGESTLDIQMAAGLAPAASINVYQTDGNADGDTWTQVNDELQQIIRVSRYFSTLLRISDATVSFRHPATRISAPSIGPVVNPNGILASIPEGS